jgi:hypothetical protein
MGDAWRYVRLGAFIGGCLKMENNFSLQIERAAYEAFILLWSQGRFGQQRLGQAFYNHFNLHKLTDQASLHNLYESDGEKASGLILRLFNFH